MDNTLNTLINRVWHEVLDGARCASPWMVAPIRGLLDHDLAGGHACQKHVGKSVDDLTGRLLSEPNTPVASTFWDMESATAAVCYLTATNTLDIIDWACGGRPRIKIEGVIPVRTSIGFSVVRGGSKITLCKKARMVLQRGIGHDFHILTTFPLQ